MLSCDSLSDVTVRPSELSFTPYVSSDVSVLPKADVCERESDRVTSKWFLSFCAAKSISLGKSERKVSVLKSYCQDSPLTVCRLTE